MSKDKLETETEPEQINDQEPAPQETVIDAEFEPVDETTGDAEELIGKKSRPAWALVWLLIFLALVFGGAVGGLAQRYFPYLPARPSAEASQISALQTQVISLQDKLANLPAPDVDALTRRVAELENAQQNATAESEPVDLSPIQDEIRKLAGQVASLEARPVPTADGKGATVNLQPILDRLNALETAQPDLSLYARKTDIPAIVDLSGLDDRLAKLEAEENQSAVQAPDLSAINARLDKLETLSRTSKKNEAQAAWSQLQLAGRTSEPFDDALQAALKVWPGNAGLQSLNSMARNGVATKAQLHQQFAALIPELMQLEHAAPKDAGWLQKAGAAMGSLVSVRDTSGEGDSVDARIARAEAALGAGDLQTAITQVSALPKKFAGATKAWLQAAQSRRKLDAVLNQSAPKPEGDRQASEATP